MSWLREERADVAVERILDVAAELFADKGIPATGMADVARAAGCSRATLYRYFDGKHALQLAFVHREARRLGAAVAVDVDPSAEPGAVLVDAMLTAVRLVRAQPTLDAWFRIDASGIATDIANSSEVIEAISSAFLARMGVAGDDRRRLARWVVRIIVSLLTVPGTDDADERAMLEQFVAPTVVGRASNFTA